MLRFADDIAIIVNNKKYLGKWLKTVDKTFKDELNMKINVQKTEIRVCEKVKLHISGAREI